ncbi:MAG: substrate-binding domain-containing protein [Arenibacterium sp.]
MHWQRAAIFAALFLFSLGRVASAQDVTLTSRDGSVEISGTLLGFDGEFYRVDTQFGELTVDGTGVRCSGPACPNLLDFVAEVAFSGSSTMAEKLMPALIQGFALRNRYTVARLQEDETNVVYELSQKDTAAKLARFRVRVTNTDEGFADLLANETDLVLAQREIRESENALAIDAGMGDMTGPGRSRVLALDAMVPVISMDNPVREISTLDLARVFAGEVINWSELGGPDAPIALHLAGLGSGLAQAVEDYLIKPASLDLAETITRHKISSSIVEAVESDPFAIGLASFAEAESARVLTLSGGCGFQLAANRRSIKTEDYPLSSPMFLYLPARRLPQAGRAFLAYLRSPAAQVVIRRAGFVDQAAEEIPIDAQGDRFANAVLSAGEEVGLDELQRMVDVLKPLSRLTISFRFEPGSSRPDAQSRANINTLATLIEAGEYDGRRMVFVGFSDGEGAASGNKRIARARARAVRDAVLADAEAATLGLVDIQLEAFGEALPMACDDTEWGRKANRRVEVWVR